MLHKGRTVPSTEKEKLPCFDLQIVILEAEPGYQKGKCKKPYVKLLS